MKNKYFAIICMILFPLFAFTQQIMDLPQLPQLPIHSVHRIFQDKEGYIWYGTSDGLCRDDGYNVQIFRSDIHTLNVMQSNLIYVIAEDSRNQLWLGTEKGVYILNKSTFRVHQLDNPETKDRRITSINSTTDGCMWIGIPNGLCRFLPDETLKTLYPLNKGYGHVDSFYEDPEHNIWVCVGGEGLCKINRDTENIESFAQKKEAYENFIIQDKNRKYYWVGTWGNGIKRFDPNTTKELRYIPQSATYSSHNDMDNHIINMVQDDVFGYLWVTTLNNLLAFSINPQGMLEPVNTSSYLSTDNKMLSEVIKDKDKNLWVAAYDRKSFIINLQGSYVNEYKVSALQQRINVNPAIVSLCKDDDDGLFWLSQDRYGICLYSPGPEETLVHYNDCPDTRDKPLQAIPYLIKSRKRGKIWAMSDRANVYGVRQSNLSMKMEETIDLKDVTDTPGTLETIYEDSSGNLWMGTTTGLFVYHPDGEIPEVIKGISGNAAGITETTDGAIWVCVSRKGVYKIEKDKTTQFFPNDKNLSCIDATSDGKLWIGTFSSEILFLDPSGGNNYMDYSHTCDMKGDVLEMISVDSFNHLWILTNQQVKEFNPRNNVFKNYSAPRKSFLLDRYLPRAAYKASDNTIYFGGIPGFISIKASNRLESMPKQVKPIVTNVTVDGESLFFDKHLSPVSDVKFDLKPNSHNIEISFSILDYWNASQIRYAYKLSGIDRDWNYTANGNNTAFFYNRLGKGEYTFQVKATDENGLWSDHITAFTINKLPAWHETWWAYTLYTLILGGIVFIMLYLYMQKVKQENNKKVLDLIAQMKLHYFTNISHDQMMSQLEDILHEHQQKQDLFRKTPSIEINKLKTPSQNELLIIKALQIVEVNLGVPNFDINKLAEELNMTRITLSRKLKTITGQTPLEFIRDIKMNHACHMLQNPVITIGEVVIALGYTDHGYFTTIFKNTFGITPSEYQNHPLKSDR
jgi:ligand-binding sensor domain-containing protein/AraC-like DNA-binding protein